MKITAMKSFSSYCLKKKTNPPTEDLKASRKQSTNSSIVLLTWMVFSGNRYSEKRKCDYAHLFTFQWYAWFCVAGKFLVKQEKVKGGTCVWGDRKKSYHNPLRLELWFPLGIPQGSVRILRRIFSSDCVARSTFSIVTRADTKPQAAVSTENSAGTRESTCTKTLCVALRNGRIMHCCGKNWNQIPHLSHLQSLFLYLVVWPKLDHILSKIGCWLDSHKCMDSLFCCIHSN